MAPIKYPGSRSKWYPQLEHEARILGMLKSGVLRSKVDPMPQFGHFSNAISFAMFLLVLLICMEQSNKTAG